ncbi:hypothetical protein C6503_06230 [Candidatus Poribacteria bacterium]|nr:MAG: hypothetical protein C6503_06230 [Candidatus Poribacteria bacterium]
MRTNKLQRIWKPFYLLSLLTAGFLLLYQPASEGYIAKRYSVPEIVKESTNVVYGTITVVNTERQTADIKVEENLKGTSEFEVIKIRLDTWKGEKDYRKEIIGFLKVGEPIIVFYEQKGGRINSIAHTRGKWFQTQATKQRDRGWGRWMFTHFEKYLNKDEVSRRDSTPGLLKELQGMLGEDAIQLFLLRTDNYKEESPAISDINSIGERWIAYHGTTNRDLPGLSKADILWLGFRTLSRDGRYRLNNKQENQIKEFVKKGGVVIVSGQDSDEENPCRTGWLPEPLNGVESSRRDDFQPTSDAGELFKAPHRIRSGDLALDDSWSGWNQKYQVLATTNGGKEIVVAKLQHGKGMYLITNLRNSQRQEVSKNRRMLENLVHFAVDFITASK